MTQHLAARPWLAPLVPLYRLGLALRELGLRTGLEPVRRLRWPVISIGNLSIGGAGKTPLTIALAQALTRRGLHVDVLSRGYGRCSRVAARVDPGGTAEEYGDEPILIAREAGVPVYVAAQRYEAGVLAERDAEESLKTKAEGLNPYPEPPREAGASAAERNLFGVHLLDDGFQHRQLYRDVNILLLDGRECSGGRLLPAGNLREPLTAMRRANVLAIPAVEAAALEPVLRTAGRWQGPIWRLHRQMDVPPVEGPVIAFCGIARPEQFFDGLRSAGLRLANCIAFPDHHRYTQADIDRLRGMARNGSAAAFVSTEKDRVRLGALEASFSKPCVLKTARLRIDIESRDAAVDWLMDRLSSRLPQDRQ